MGWNPVDEEARRAYARVQADAPETIRATRRHHRPDGR